jgi:rhodanese-related sulfurtransferase
VYCHSGRRSAIAAEKMSNAGLTVLDGGAFDNMIAQGWTIGS